MKKLSLKNPLVRKKQPTNDPPARITNETVAEHREKVLAGGRRFKYPIQYAKHKLVINALLITLASLIVFAVLGAVQLYVVQDSSGFIYRFTKIFPAPVGTVDGYPVRYSDYLVKYRGSKYYLGKYDEIKLDSEGGKKQLEHIKRQSLNGAIADSYAEKLAASMNITVSAKDIDDVVAEQRETTNGQISQETYDASSKSVYDWDRDDYRHMLGRRILRSRVEFAIDEAAKSRANTISTLVKQHNGDLQRVAEEVGAGGEGDAKIQAMDTGLIAKTSTYLGLHLKDINGMQRDRVSDAIKGDDGYYFVKIIDNNDSNIRFTYLYVPLTELNKRIETLRTEGKIQEFIQVAQEA